MRRTLTSLFLLATLGSAASAQSASATAACGRVGGGGGMNLSSRVFASFAYVQEANGKREFDAIVVRGRDGWVYQQTRGRTLTDPLPRKVAEGLAGGTIDTLWLRVDMKRRVAWIHDRSVPLDGGNVLLVDRIDGAGGPLEILGVVRVPFPGASDADCEGGTMNTDFEVLRSLLLSNPDVKRFVGVDERPD